MHDCVRMPAPAVLVGERLRAEVEAAGYPCEAVVSMGGEVEIHCCRPDGRAMGKADTDAIRAVVQAHQGGPSPEEEAAAAAAAQRQRAADLLGAWGDGTISDEERAELAGLLAHVVVNGVPSRDATTEGLNAVGI